MKPGNLYQCRKDCRYVSYKNGNIVFVFEESVHIKKGDCVLCVKEFVSNGGFHGHIFLNKDGKYFWTKTTEDDGLFLFQNTFKLISKKS